ncbi:MAG: hypothetical protein L6R36_003619 [Xanthoria steineri]|nr:MAG: hypothetical protein L6R36_003619 [Xanthoria steineri]
MASPALSQASTAFESDPPQFHEHEKSQPRALQHVKEAATSQDILLFLIAFRILNALSIRTFFQPDEYFQSLEPAWEIAFGPDSGAWITWEWKNQLRSAIHPALFAGVYWVSAELSKLLQLTPYNHAELLLAAPKVTQAVIAAFADYYTWRLGERMYGRGSNEAWAALFLTVVSPWQWFVSTRTLSNCLETTLTIVALHQWPWHWSLDATGDVGIDKYGLREEPQPDQVRELAKCVSEKDEVVRRARSTAYRLCRCLLLAAVACVLRPTNILIWICLACFSLWKSSSRGRILKLPRVEGGLWVNITSIAHGPATRRERMVLVLEAVVCGSLVLASSAIVDRLYYQQWTFPPLRFLYFNLARSLSVHYGKNDWHYYLTQGYPLLLTTFLPFALIGLYQSLFPQDSPPTQALLTANIKRQLATTSILVPFTLSFISHKEVRFIYPLLPPLHLLSAKPFATYFFSTPSKHTTRKRLLLTLILTTNLLLAIFTTTLYQQAPLNTLAYLRSRTTNTHPITIAFLTPCHSTPWRSHLIHPSLKAWALTCEPPLHLPPSHHPTYRDEADLFYHSPTHWLAQHLGRAPKNSNEQQLRLSALETATGVAWDGKWAHVDEKGRERERDGGKKVWTGYLVAFGQLEGELGRYLRGSGYGVCWRGWNGWGHEDWRRRGGMVVWCLDEGEKRAWRDEERGRGEMGGWKGFVGKMTRGVWSL